METMAGAQPPLLLRFHLVQMRVLHSVETGDAYKAGIDMSGLDLAVRGAFFAAGSDALNRLASGCRAFPGSAPGPEAFERG